MKTYMVKKMEMKLNFDCIVVGAGPAGLTASIYLKRANLNVLVIEKEMPGGQMNYASLIENYPGFTSIEGPTLASNMYNQAKALGVDFKLTEVLEISDLSDYIIVKTKNEELTCKNVILSTGRQRRKLGVPREEELVGKGISYCALCDGMFFKDKNVLVIGGGNSAVEEAISLAKIVKHVTLIHRSQSFKAEAILVQEMLNIPNITVVCDTVVNEFLEKENKISGVIARNVLTNEISQMDVEGIFISIGYGPNELIFAKTNIKEENGYIIVDKNNRTTVDNIYACGDVTSKDVYQIVTAVGDGALAATSIIRGYKKERR